MWNYFAATTDTPSADPVSYYFTQGVLGVTVILLLITLRFMWNYFTKEIEKKDIKIDLLQNARLEDNKIHTLDYREMAKNDQTVLSGNSQANELLASKIEAVKGKR